MIRRLMLIATASALFASSCLFVTVAQATHPKQPSGSVPEDIVNAIVWVEVGCPPGSITVHYSTESGSAKAGSDFRSVSGDLTFQLNGPQRQQFIVPIIDDRVAEPAEDVAIVLMSSGVDMCGCCTATVSGALTIYDDDGYEGPQSSTSTSDLHVSASTATPPPATHLPTRPPAAATTASPQAAEAAPSPNARNSRPGGGNAGAAYLFFGLVALIVAGSVWFKRRKPG